MDTPETWVGCNRLGSDMVFLCCSDNLAGWCSRNISGPEPEVEGATPSPAVDNVNGVNNDNRRENLRLLCPNCNSQQGTFAGRNRQRK